jgi:SAM-dependent methyltransferase
MSARRGTGIDPGGLNPLRKLIEHFISLRQWRYLALRWQERLRGVDFTSVAQPEDVGLNPARAHMVTPSDARALRRVFRELRITSTDAVIDVGCGKGVAMKCMLEFPFLRVDGIEASAHIAQIALANLRTLKVDARRYSVTIADAAEYTPLDRYTHLYFFNPFPCHVMASFMTNVLASLARSPRPVTIVYDNPVCHETIVGTGAFVRHERDYPDEWGNRICVYSSRPL